MLDDDLIIAMVSIDDCKSEVVEKGSESAQSTPPISYTYRKLRSYLFFLVSLAFNQEQRSPKEANVCETVINFQVFPKIVNYFATLS